MPTMATARETALSNLEAEQALLGSILLTNDALALALDIVETDDFFSDAHRITFGAMTELADAGHTIDLVTLSEELNRQALFEKAGGARYLAGLTDGVPVGTSVAVSEYARIIKEKSKARRLLNLVQNISARINEGNNNADELVELARAEIQGLGLKDLTEKTDSGKVEVIGKVDPQTETAKKPKKPENIYPLIRKEAWHPAAELYRRAHENCTEGSDNWHFITFYTVVGSMLGRTVGTRMGQMIYGNLYSVVVGQLGGDGKDTCADFGTNLIDKVDPKVYIPEALDSKPGFCKGWDEFNQREQILTNHRALLRMPEIRTYLDTAKQTGTQSVTPMLLTHYAPRRSLDNDSIATPAHIKDPHLSILACGAKRFIGQIPEADLINGLGRRICFVAGDPKGPNDDPPEPDNEILIPLASRIKEALELYQGISGNGTRGAACLRFSPEAKRLWKDWYKTYWKRKRGDDLLAALNNGDRVTCRKIALINAALDKQLDFILPEHLEPAMAFVEFLYGCRWPIFAEHGDNPYVEIEKKILAMIPEYPNRISKRYVQMYLRSIDTKTFNDRIRYMTMDDGPVVRHQEGRKVFLSRAK